MQFLNKNVHGHVEVGHIDLLQTQSYFEVPEEDAERVMRYVSGQRYKGREVRCNDAAEGGKKPTTPTKPTKPTRPTTKPTTKPTRPTNPTKPTKSYKKDEWMQFLNPKSMRPKANKELKGEIPDFEEEGWAIRKPRKK